MARRSPSRVYRLRHRLILGALCVLLCKQPFVGDHDAADSIQREQSFFSVFFPPLLLFSFSKFRVPQGAEPRTPPLPVWDSLLCSVQISMVFNAYVVFKFRSESTCQAIVHPGRGVLLFSRTVQKRLPLQDTWLRGPVPCASVDVIVPISILTWLGLWDLACVMGYSLTAGMWYAKFGLCACRDLLTVPSLSDWRAVACCDSSQLSYDDDCGAVLCGGEVVWLLTIGRLKSASRVPLRPSPFDGLRTRAAWVFA